MTEPSPPKSAAISDKPTAPSTQDATSSGAAALATADAQSLEVLFSRDPFEMIVEDEKGARNFETIVAALRRQRAAWKAAEAAGATSARRKAAKAKVTTSLAELGLDD
jgi:hypothetical protein